MFISVTTVAALIGQNHVSFSVAHHHHTFYFVCLFFGVWHKLHYFRLILYDKDLPLCGKFASTFSWPNFCISYGAAGSKHRNKPKKTSFDVIPPQRQSFMPPGGMMQSLLEDASQNNSPGKIIWIWKFEFLSSFVTSNPSVNFGLFHVQKWCHQGSKSWVRWKIAQKCFAKRKKILREKHADCRKLAMPIFWWVVTILTFLDIFRNCDVK